MSKSQQAVITALRIENEELTKALKRLADAVDSISEDIDGVVYVHQVYAPHVTESVKQARAALKEKP